MKPDDGIRVTLTWHEFFRAAQTGVTRQIQNLAKGRQDFNGAPEERGWQFHIEGACGECAVARALNQYWSGNLGDLKADDVGALQVRTRRLHDYGLILHKKDPDDRIFVLVTGVAPELWVRGWLYAHEGKLEKWWSDPAGGRPAYFVPASALHPMHRLSPAGLRLAS